MIFILKIYQTIYSLRNTLNVPLLVNNEELNSNAFNLNSRGMNIGHLNIQGICGEKFENSQN